MIRAKTDQVEQRPGHGLGLNELGNSSAPDGTTATARSKVACVMCPRPPERRPSCNKPGLGRQTGRIWRAIGAALGVLAAQMVSRAWNPCTLSVWISHRDRDWFQSALLAAVGPVRVRNSTGFSHTTGPGRDRPRWRSAAVVNEFFRHVPVSHDPSGKSGTCP